MILGNQIEWALHCLPLLAALPNGKRLATKDLADFHGVPKEYLLKALQKLSNAGLVDGSIGKSGGYKLAKKPDNITFLDVVTALEGNKSTFNCTEIRQNIPCKVPKSAFSKPCQVARVMYKADEAWRAVLRETTILDLVQQVEQEVHEEILSSSKSWIDERMKL